MGNQSSAPRGVVSSHSHSTKQLNPTHKRRSLDLPDLAALNLNITQYNRPPTQSIPIPNPPGHNRYTNESTVSIQESVSKTLTTPAPPPSRNPSPDKDDVVISALPPPVKLEKPTVKPIHVKICWNGGGNRVMLARAGDDDWKGRQLMTKESSLTHSITIPLLPGTHHLRFLVDDQWRVADDLPTAVDDQGSLANYVGVALDGIVIGGVADASFGAEVVTTSPTFIERPRLTPGQSFWSASSNGGDNEDDGSYRYAQRHPPLPKKVARWTTDIPTELEEAAKMEDAYLQATSAQTHNVQAVQTGAYHSPSSPGPKERGRDRGHAHGHTPSRGGGQTQIINGFVPPPPIPLAPHLPRQLDKLILNVNSYPRAVTAHGTVVGATGGARRDNCRDNRKSSRRDRERKSVNLNLPLPSDDPTNPPSVTTSPTLSPDLASALPDHVSPLPTPSITIEHSPPLPKTAVPAIDDTVSADDTSVLPVPSHVVLHHLTTSAIKNGVLAVGCTVRYKKKYLTTIYYKPT